MAADTICALATPPGQAGIAVVRISGPDTLTILDGLFRGPRPSRQPSHTVRIGWIHDHEGNPLDQVVLTVYRAPRSYTGENLAEVSCHGGPYIVDRILKTLLAAGCRLAGPGEFTRRAVLNGKMTLSQAAAVVDLVSASTAVAHADACLRYGSYQPVWNAEKKTLDRLRQQIIDLLAEMEYQVGFEQNESVHSVRLRRRMQQLTTELHRILRQAEQNRFLHDGARVVIVGRPNVGKSSLFNRLLGTERTIVSPYPGTTRDAVEAKLFIGNFPVHLVDTGGITSISTCHTKKDQPPTARKTQSPATSLLKMAVHSTRREIEHANLVIAVFDGASTASADDHALFALLAGRHTIYVINKTDRPQRLKLNLPATRTLSVSCLTGANIARLRHRLVKFLRIGHRHPITDLAFIEALRSTAEALHRAAESIDTEAAAFELRAALTALTVPEQIPPESSTADYLTKDLLDRIFARFCVGK